MASILSILGAVRNIKQRREVKSELEKAKQEREQAAEERRVMQETLDAYVNNRHNSSNSDGYEYQGNGYTNQPVGMGYPQAGAGPYGAPQPYTMAQPLGAPMQGVPMQGAPYSPYSANGPAMATRGAGVEYCGVCEAYHPFPMCAQGRKEHRQSRKERRQASKERREASKERRQQRREGR